MAFLLYKKTNDGQGVLYEKLEPTRPGFAAATVAEITAGNRNSTAALSRLPPLEHVLTLDLAALVLFK